MRLPNFVVIGAAKCGTTSLHHYLRQHPQVYLPERKELNYFTYEQMQQNSCGPGDAEFMSRFCATREAYEAHYAEADALAVGDVSPSYFYYDEVAGERIQRELGDVKVILLLRDPIQKAFSQYMHLVRDNRETLDFFDALMAEPERIRHRWAGLWRYAESSLYAARLRRYLRRFGGGRMRVIIFEDFARDTSRVVAELFEFLGVDPSFQPKMSMVYNPSGRPRSKLLANLLIKSNPIASAARKALSESTREQVRTLLLRLNTGRKGTISGQAREHLRGYFRDDVAEVEDALDQRLNWLN